MLDRRVFLRPIAHRGLHGLGSGSIENTAPAFESAIAKGYGIECDLQALADGTPIVFHDFTLDRLTESSGPVAALSPTQVAKLRYKGRSTGIIAYADLLALVGGRVPLLVEIKSDWTPPNQHFLTAIAALSRAYVGPLGLMSFDPVVMTVLRELAPGVPRGIVSGRYEGEDWWPDKIDPDRALRLTYLLESEPAAPDFYSYHVSALPTPVTRYVREVQRLPLFCWTVRTQDEWRRAKAWSDAPTFEGFEP